MEKDMIRLLHADEIECRTASVREKGLSLLLYKDARVDQKILDETFGPFGWKRSHQCINGNLYCTVEIYDRESGCWVAKQDVGAAGHTEKEKSQASDSFKRACFNWGIGRELYTAPFIWIPAGRTEIQSREGRWFCSDRFSVQSIDYNRDREITGLSIVNGSGRTVYELIAGKEKAGGKNAGSITEEQIDSLEAELERTGVDMETVKGRYKFDRMDDMSAELYSRVMRALARTKSAGAA